MVSTLRTYLKEIEGNINEIEREVDPKTQIGDLCSQSKKPILFQNVKGYPSWKICDLLVKERKTQAIALRATSDKVVADLAEKFARGRGATRCFRRGRSFWRISPLLRYRSIQETHLEIKSH